MAQINGINSDNQYLASVIDRPLEIRLSPPQEAKHAIADADFDLETDTSKIDRAILKRLKWSKAGMKCPRAGETVLLSLRHPYYGSRIVAEFLIVEDPNIKVRLGRVACRAMLGKWTEESRDRAIQLLIKVHNPKGLIHCSYLT